MRTKTVIAIGILTATVAWAGTAVYGYGETRSAAAADAERKARELSTQRHGRPNCVTPMKPSDCKKDDGGWVCEMFVDNHSGSCRR